MPLPPRPKSRPIVRRVLAVSTIAALGCGGEARNPNVPPQVVPPRHDPVPPQVNCMGQYAGDCVGTLTVIITDVDHKPLANRTIEIELDGQLQQHTTNERGEIELARDAPPHVYRLKINADGFSPGEQSVSVDRDPVRVPVVLRPK
jgi:hypothetical protein